MNLMQSECANELESNTTRWVPVPGTNDTIPDPEIVDALCPSNCSNNGHCLDGKIKTKVLVIQKCNNLT